MRTSYKNQEALEQQLIVNGIDTTDWGVGSSKTVLELFNELLLGESVILGKLPIRYVSFVMVFIQMRDGSYFLEAQQEYRDGRMRKRIWPLSERIRHGESPTEAALRGFREELQIKSCDVFLNQKSLKRYRRDIVSPSYPGLRTSYEIVSVAAEVPCLPEYDVITYENGDSLSVIVRRHYWGCYELTSQLVQLIPSAV